MYACVNVCNETTSIVRSYYKIAGAVVTESVRIAVVGHKVNDHFKVSVWTEELRWLSGITDLSKAANGNDQQGNKYHYKHNQPCKSKTKHFQNSLDHTGKSPH